jgi:predicted TIM-barrel fold metal-dependent hydrolase
VETFLKLPFSDQTKRKYLWENCARLYGFDNDG